MWDANMYEQFGKARMQPLLDLGVDIPAVNQMIMLRTIKSPIVFIQKAKEVTLGVFENNQAAYHCYKAAGSRDVHMEKPEYYHVCGEDWKCLELRKEAGGMTFG